MNCSKKLAALALATCASALLATTASAQNPGFENGNLFLGFQTTGAGNSSYVIANIGDTSTFRDYPSSSNQINIANVGSALTAQFGANWYERTDVFMGAAGAFTNDEFEGPRNGDDPLTIYVATPRFLSGPSFPEGTAGSFALTLPSAAAVQNAANGIAGANFGFESLGTGSTSTISSGALFVDYDNQNSFAGANQNASYDGTFSGGTQSAFGVGSVSFGGVQAEAILDLYRITPDGSASFEGSLAIDALGNVSFINGLAAVPEPSTALGFGLLVGLAGAMKRRRVVAA